MSETVTGPKWDGTETDTGPKWWDRNAGTEVEGPKCPASPSPTNQALQMTYSCSCQKTARRLFFNIQNFLPVPEEGQ